MKPIKIGAWVSSGLLTCGLAALYLFMLPQNLTWANSGGDGGDFLAAALTGGVPHPSGYPLYMLWMRLVEWLPWGTVYGRGALLSALPAALAAGLACLWVQAEVTQSGKGALWAGLTAGLAWGTAPLLWSQAVIVEVHGMQSLCVVLALFWFSRLARGVGGVGTLLLALAFGLSLGNHLTLLLLAPLVLAGGWLAHRRGLDWDSLAVQAGLTIFGLSVYLYLPLSARTFPPVNWGNPQSLSGFWWVVSGQLYQGLLFHTPPVQVLERLAAWARLLMDQFGLVGILIGVIGAVYFPLSAPYRWGLIWVFAVFSIFSIGYASNDSYGYLIPAILAFAVWIGLGTAWLLPFLWHGRHLGMWMGGAVLFFFLAKTPFTARQVDPRSDTRAVDYSAAYFRLAPQGALLLTQADADTFPLWYAHFGLHERPDVRVVVLPLTQFGWYRETLAHTYPDLNLPPLDGIPGSEWGRALPALNRERAVCESSLAVDEPWGVRFECQP